MKKNIIYTLLLSALFSACTKDVNKPDNNTTASEDHAALVTHANDITNIGEQASTGSMTTYRMGNQTESIYSGCAVITTQNTISSNPDTLTVNFGTGCTGLDGRTRSGILQYIYTGGMHYRDSGNVINVYANNYVVDGNAITLNSKTITNQGHISQGKLTWGITTNMSLSKPNNGGTISCIINHTKVLLQGEQPNNAPIDWANGQIALYGTASGTATSGQTFSAVINENTWLVRNFACGAYRKYFVAGELDFTPQGRATRYVNFGTGACDNTAVVVINGVVYNITLH
ncbi:MAG: hypothetical protein JST67_03530 [Bacteroidetes bacterium]|nr:hypothetical protein [Bacteroidota bacterium]